jgi:hypothetical protein
MASECLVALLDPLQDVDGLALGRARDLHALEPPLEAPVTLDVLAVLGGRRGADALDLAARQRGLEDVGGVEGALGRPRPDQRMELVDEDDDVGVLGELLHDGLEALFELSAVLGAGHDERDVEGQDALVGEEQRHVAVDDLVRESLDDRGLSDAGLADEHRVVLGPPAEDLDGALELALPPDERVELPSARGFGQVAAELREKRGLFGLGHRRLLVQFLDNVFAYGIDAESALVEDGGGNGLLLAENSQEDVLGPDIVVNEPFRLFGGESQNPLGFRGEWNLDGSRDLIPDDDAAFDLLANALHRKMGLREDPARETFALANQSEQEVLGFDRVAAQLCGFIAREEDDPLGALGVSLEHVLHPNCCLEL